jgi:putative NADPH-quinone reductase
LARRIVIIQGHPDRQAAHFGHALADMYAQGAEEAGHEVRHIHVAALDFPLLRSKDDWDTLPCPASLQPSQQTIQWADHLVILFPLWLGSMPAMLKAFLEQVFRPDFAISRAEPGKSHTKLLHGKSARIVVTMGMPALVYRLFYRAHSLKSLERNILSFCGIAPVRTSVIGMVEGSASGRESWLAEMRRLGAAAR